MFDVTYGGFVPYIPPLPKGEGPAPVEELQTPNTSATSGTNFKGSAQQGGLGAPVEAEGGRKTAPKKIKKTFNDISKWNTLQTELTTIAAPVSSESQGQGQGNGQGVDGDQSHVSIKHVTLEGGVTVTKVYCLLCRRKFTSMDHLKRHEALSQLHKDNLSKSSSNTSGGVEEGGVLYRDRASERRALHGQEGVVDNLRGVGGGTSHGHKEDKRDVATSSKKSAYRLETLKRMEVVDPTLAQMVTQSSGNGETNPSLEGSTGEIPDDNIGSKLLGKMGWKKGEGLGVTKSGIVNPIGVENANKGGVGLGMKRGL
jgi:RNA-binding protein 5/10